MKKEKCSISKKRKNFDPPPPAPFKEKQTWQPMKGKYSGLPISISYYKIYETIPSPKKGDLIQHLNTKKNLI